MWLFKNLTQQMMQKHFMKKNHSRNGTKLKEHLENNSLTFSVRCDPPSGLLLYLLPKWATRAYISDLFIYAHWEMASRVPTQLGAINNPCVRKGMWVRCFAKGAGNELLGPCCSLPASWGETALCPHVSLCLCHLRSGRGRCHQGSLCSLGHLAWLLW